MAEPARVCFLFGGGKHLAGMQRYIFNCLIYNRKKKLCLTVGQEFEQEMKQIIIMYHKNIKIFVFVPKKIMPGCILHR